MSPIEGTKEQLDKVCAGQVCAEHGLPVAPVFTGNPDVWVIRCGKGEFVKALKKIGTVVETIKRGLAKDVPLHFLNLPIKDLGDAHALTNQEKDALVEFAVKYGLDPYRAHVASMYSQPYITIDGYCYYAMRTKQPYTLGSRPLTQKERKEYQIGEDDFAWIAEGELLTTGSKGTGLGIVTADEMSGKSKKTPDQLRSPVVAAHPQLMAQKRAEWQWFRRVFPIGDSGDGLGQGVDGVVPETVVLTEEQQKCAHEQAKKDSKELF
jgi:hypothetical protein